MSYPEGVRCVKGPKQGVRHRAPEGRAMSARHRNNDVAPPPRADLRAHAHNERHRIKSQLHLVVEAVDHGTEPLDIEEPGVGWKPMHHRDAQRAVEKNRRKPFKHWKTKDWKRRKANRQNRARMWDQLAS